MRSRSVRGSIVLFVIGFTMFANTEVCGEDWKFYSQTAEALYYFDAKSETPSDKNVIRVQVRLNFTDKGLNEMVEKFGERYRNISHELNDYEINCADKMFRVLAVTRYSKEGKILLTVSRDEAGWTSIPPDSTSESLYKEVCK
jgi:hypothetical protein